MTVRTKIFLHLFSWHRVFPGCCNKVHWEHQYLHRSSLRAITAHVFFPQMRHGPLQTPRFLLLRGRKESAPDSGELPGDPCEMWSSCWPWGPATSRSRVERCRGKLPPWEKQHSHCWCVRAHSRLCTMGERFLNPGHPRYCLSPAHLNLPSMWGASKRNAEVAGGYMRSSPAHCRAKLTFTLDATCTVMYSSTTISPVPELCPDPQQQLPVPLCSAKRPASCSSGRRQAACRRVSDMAAACLHGQSAVLSAGLGNERCESISPGIAQPFPVLLEKRRGRGGAGQIMTLPSLLTFISPCNVLGCLTLFCN